MRLLIIDDEADVRAIVRRSLERETGVEVLQAPTPAEGLLLSKASKLDGILLDVVMPGMDGRAVRAELEKDPLTSNIPVIFLTGTSDESELAVLRQLSRGVIHKPINLKTFNAEVLRLLGDEQARQTGVSVLNHVADAAAPRLPSLEELRDRFIRGSEARIQSLTDRIAVLESQPGDLESLDLLMRGFHSLAGIGTTHGFPKVTVLARAAERRCNELLRAKAPVSASDLAEVRALLEALAAEFTGSDRASSPRDDAAQPAAYSALLAVTDSSLRKLLQERGLRVQLTATIADARKLLEGFLPDALIVESELPDGIGYEIIEHLRSKPGGAGTLALVVGGLSGFLDKVEAIRCGADGFFEDPVDWDAVIRRVELHKEQLATEAPRILSVEDDPEQAEFLETVLRSAGYQVLVCKDPRDFESALTSFRPDLILMDILLPGMSGQDLARYVRQNPAYATLPLMFLTTEDQIQSRIETLRAGADDYLIKPVAPGLLISSVAARLERARFLQSLLDRDGLTGLLTHTAFLERARNAIAQTRRSAKRSALVMVDLDHFKTVNDTYGHPTGDRVLISLAALFRRRLRQSDSIGRYGGEEFALIVDDLDKADAIRLVDRLREEFSQIDHHSTGGKDFRITFSAGVSIFGDDIQTVDQWKEAADQALYLAKARGRNRVESHSGAAPSPSNFSAIDEASMQALRELQGDDDPEFVRLLIDTFLAEIPDVLKNLDASVESDDPEKLALTAHSFKGSCVALGALGVARICDELETLGRRGPASIARVTELMSALNVELQRVRSELTPPEAGTS